MAGRRVQPAADWAPPRRRSVAYEDDLRGVLAEDDYEEHSAANELLDRLLPANLDWRRLVRDYPLPALAVAAIGGYWLARSSGPRILGALTGFAAANVTKAAQDILGEDLFVEE